MKNKYSPFRELKVTDISTVLAGPSVGSFFAELGAEVTKVEKPGGDVTRTWFTAGENENNVSSYFASVNYGKKYIVLDFTRTSDYDQLLNLIGESDILISNFKDGNAEKFGLGDEALSILNPALIHGKISGFIDNPGRVAYDVVLQAETGYMSMNGTETSGPVKMPVAMIDVIAAHQLKEGILCALFERASTGKGRIVECTLDKAALSALTNQASNYLMNGNVAKRIGTLHPNIAPYGEIFNCADSRQIVLAVGSDSQFGSLCDLTENSSLESDSRFSSNISRVMNRTALSLILEKSFLRKSSLEWIEKFIAAGIPAGVIRTLDEVLSSAAAQQMIISETINGSQTHRVSTVAFTVE